MIRKLQGKFIMASMLSVLLVVMVVVGAINISNYIRIDSQVDFILDFIADNGGEFPEYKNNTFNQRINQESEHSYRYFSVTVDENNEITDCDLTHIVVVQEDDIDSIVNKVLSRRGDSDYYGNYKYLIRDTDDGKLIVFLDCTNYLQERNSLFYNSLIIATSSMILVLILVTIFSKKAIKTTIEALEKQKEFITNAGHELKTPVAIIMANAEILEMVDGSDNEWIQSIKGQSKRLDFLIKRLLRLARVGESKSKKEFVNTDLSELVNEVYVSFKVIAGEIKYEAVIEDGIFADIDRDDFYELISILIDNAIKYVSDNGEIGVSLKKSGRRTVLDIYNDSEEMSEDECNRLFDRFYRKDSSRDRKTGGFGIGLSMARAIARDHKAKILAKYENGKVHFVVEL